MTNNSELVQSPNHVRANQEELRRAFAKRNPAFTDNNMLKFFKSITFDDTEVDLLENSTNIYHMKIMVDEMMATIFFFELYIGTLDILNEQIKTINHYEVVDNCNCIFYLNRSTTSKHTKTFEYTFSLKNHSL